jgi:hypothetical protein
MKESKPNFEEFFILPNPSLRSFLRRNEIGNSEDYRPPFWNGRSRESVVQEWMNELEHQSLWDEFPGLLEYEKEQASKVGPMSIRKPLVDRMDDVRAYFTDIDAVSEPIAPEAIAQTVDFFSSIRGVRERSKFNTLRHMKLSTNSGNPYFTRRSRVFHDVINSDVFYSPTDGWCASTPKGVFRLAAILGWRGQEGGFSEEDVKQRVIWMMSMILNLAELQTYQPFISAVQVKNLIPAYVSMDAVDIQVTNLFNTKGTNDPVICTDFSRFDQHFNLDMQNAAYQVLEQLTHGHHTGLDVFRAKFEVPIICSGDIMIEGQHGMGSGSGGTNFDECLAHKALQFEAALNAGSNLNPYSMAYGDDGILSFPGITIEQIVSDYSKHGQEMNDSKQFVSLEECIVLRRWHHIRYLVNDIMVGVYPTCRALGRLLAQERFYSPDLWSKEMVTLRALSILENCKWSPYFTHFIEYVLSGDRYRLGLDIPGFFSNLTKYVKQAMAIKDDFLGYTKTQMRSASDSKLTGIYDWSVVKMLLSKYKPK